MLQELAVPDGEGRSSPDDADHPFPAEDQANLAARYVTLESQSTPFSLPGTLTQVNGQSNPADFPLIQETDSSGAIRYTALTTGYFALKSRWKDQDFTTYLYVSPIPSVQVENPDLNWYRTQFDTGTPSNCGPSSVSMAAAWAQGKALRVSDVRKSIGWKGDGGTSFEELLGELRSRGVAARMVRADSAKSLRKVLDSGSLAIVLIQTSKITRSRGDPETDPFGRYYSDSVGHYIVVKGYSLDQHYFVVHDPIPSDWNSNSFRQADGISMMGRNRYYPAPDLLRALKTSQIIQVSR